MKIGWDASEEIIEIADSLYNQQIPRAWCLLAGANTTIVNFSLASFIADINQRFQHIDKCMTVGRDKMPAYNLGAFYHPQSLLSLFQFEMLRAKNQGDDAGCVESIVFQTEMTSRDKEHVIKSRNSNNLYAIFQ
jgi:dynein heavy chain